MDEYIQNNWDTWFLFHQRENTMIRAYIRVSTDMQDAENQRFEILKWADEKKVTIDEWTVETVSGTRSWKDRKLGEMLASCVSGDSIVATELSRIGRSFLSVMSVLKECVDRKIKVFTLKEKYELADDVHSAVISFAFSISSQLEREMISSRTKSALARKRALGVRLGRPKGSIGKSKLDGYEQMIQELLDKGVSKASICKIVGPIHPGTLDSFLVTRKIKPKEVKAECP